MRTPELAPQSAPELGLKLEPRWYRMEPLTVEQEYNSTSLRVEVVWDYKVRPPEPIPEQIPELTSESVHNRSSPMDTSEERETVMAIERVERLGPSAKQLGYNTASLLLELGPCYNNRSPPESVDQDYWNSTAQQALFGRLQLEQLEMASDYNTVPLETVPPGLELLELDRDALLGEAPELILEPDSNISIPMNVSVEMVSGMVTASWPSPPSGSARRR